MYISTHQALLDFCQRAREFDAIAVDTEFLRERTFHPRLCLVQIATPAESVAVDPLVIDDLSPLAELMGRRERDQGLPRVLAGYGGYTPYRGRAAASHF